MPTNTSNQGITLPVGADVADAPVAFANQTSGLESRLNMRFTDTADRTARVPVPVENQVSLLGTENRTEVYDGTNWVSEYSRSMFAMVRKTANQSVSSGTTGTTLVSATDLVATLPTAGIFGFRAALFYDSPDAADIKFAFPTIAGMTGTYGIHGISTAGAGGVGTGQFSATTTFGTALICGGVGAGNGLLALIFGEVTMGGTGGALQLQFAQNTADAGNTTLRARSRMEVWRVS